MALQGSGEIKITEIVAEFGGTVPHSLSEYYRNGGAVPANNTNVSETGQISMSMFYNAVNEIQITVSADATNYQLSNAFGSNWATAVPKRLTINSGVTIGSSSTTAAMTIEGSMGGTLIVHNTGTIVGAGGAGSSNGAGAAGSNAVRSDQNGSITFYNNSGGNLYGGGGGGGKGGSGGKGGTGGRGGTGGGGQYTQQSGTMLWQAGGSSSSSYQASCQGMNRVHFSGGVSTPYYNSSRSSHRHWFCQVCGGSSYYAQGGGHHFFYHKSKKGKVQTRGSTTCARNVNSNGGGGGYGGGGGNGGAGGAGGRGAGYQQTLQSGSAGANGAGGSGGNGGANGGSNAGKGGTGGTGGTGGKGGTGGAGGNYGTAGGNGSTGNTGSTGATGSKGANGNRTQGSNGQGGSGGQAGSGGSNGGAAGYYIQNRHYMTFHNSGTVAGQ